MKRLLASLLVISAVSTLGYLGTRAYFSDTEESTGNVLAAGTIDIAVNDENPWESTAEYVFENMLPGDEVSMTQVIKNVGVNNVMLWKKIEVTSRLDNLQSEPECAFIGGVWTESSKTCAYSAPSVDDLDSQMIYGMTVDTKVNIDPLWDVTMEDVDALWVPLGLIVPDGFITVDQTYHFDEDATNAYQGDKLVFNVTYYAEQEGAPGPGYVAGSRGLILDDKTGSPNEYPDLGDGTWGILSWDASGNFEVRAWGLVAADFRPTYWDGSTQNWMADAKASSGGEVTITGNYPALETNVDAKYWLREVTSWNNANSLWESNLVN